jgi:NAD(P)-dependent dehydrogenase (short-subunit alcohol dehydrogenase family)
MKRLENKVALITGGNSGMGLVTAQTFIEQGAKVVITARRKDAVDEYNSSVNGSGKAYLADVTDGEATKEALKKTAEKYLAFDILEYLTEGSNVAGGIDDNGFYNVDTKSAWEFDKAPWRSTPAFTCEIVLEYENGEMGVIKTDESWKQGKNIY